jgi:hypothetical protein
MGTLNEPVPVPGLAVYFSAIPLIAPRPLVARSTGGGWAWGLLLQCHPTRWPCPTVQRPRVQPCTAGGQWQGMRLHDVANLLLRAPAMIAKQAAALHVFSCDRFELGLGCGPIPGRDRWLQP